MMAVQFSHVQACFREWITHHISLNNPQSKLKLIHTYYTVELAKDIAESLALPEEEIDLAKIIALLHDIGRFKQSELYHTFREDRIKIDHAKLGVEILFKDHLIEEWLTDTTNLSVIRQAIACHSLYTLDNVSLTAQEALHCRILRDADKLDNFRVRLSEDISQIANVEKEAFLSSTISPKVFEIFMSHQTILSADRKTEADIWVSYLAQIFGLYFLYSYQYVQENHLIEQMKRHYSFNLLDTEIKMQTMCEEVSSYVQERCKQLKQLK